MYPHSSSWRPLAILGGFVVACVLGTSTVTVKAGDTLTEIAARHDVTVDQLADWNDLEDPDRILAGATLIVSRPQNDTGAGTATQAPPPGAYTVSAGDTLSAIARRFGTSVARLVSANRLVDPDRIIEGQALQVGGTANAAPVLSGPVTATSYTVLAGDTLSSIAARYGLKVGVVARDNGITDPDRIRVGQILTIGGTGPATPTSPTITTTDPTTTTAPVATSGPATTAPTVTSGPVATTRSGEVLLATLFVRWADSYSVPRDLLEALAWKESDWRADAIGPGGELGIAQLSPDTVDFIESRLIGRELNPLSASDGLQLASRYLRYLIDRTEDEREALAAWHQGLASVQSNGISDSGASFADAVLEIRRQRA